MTAFRALEPQAVGVAVYRGGGRRPAGCESNTHRYAPLHPDVHCCPLEAERRLQPTSGLWEIIVHEGVRVSTQSNERVLINRLTKQPW